MLPAGRSSRLFLQRLGIEPTVRLPAATVAPATLIFNRVALAAPLPVPDLLVPPPCEPRDAMRTRGWPAGDAAAYGHGAPDPEEPPA